MTNTVIHLPMPPSVNALWRVKRSGRPTKSKVATKKRAVQVYPSKRYKAWKDEADALYLANKKNWKPIKGRFRAHITFNEKKRRGDLDNRIKAIFDWAQRAGLIENDKLCDDLSAFWGDTTDGCTVVLGSNQPLEMGAA